MTMIYFAGERLDWKDPNWNNWNNRPIVVRGYDAAGNLLSIIRSDFIPGTKASIRDTDDAYYISGYTKNGLPVTITHFIGSNYNPCYPGALEVSSDGRIYWASGPWWGYVGGTWTEDVLIDFFRVYNRNGDRIPFPQLHGSLIKDFKFDSEGNIIVGGEYNGPSLYTLRKYDNSGNLLWSVNTGNVVLCIAIDSSDNIYIGGSEIVSKYNSSGVLQWSKSLYFLQVIYSIAVDSSYVYYGGFANGGRIEKRNISDGEIVATVLSAYANRITLSGSTIYSVEWDQYSSTRYKKFDTNLNLLTDVGYDDLMQLVARDGYLSNPAVDINGNVYFCGNRRGTVAGSVNTVNLFHFCSVTSANEKRWETLAATMLPGINIYGLLRTDDNYLLNDYITAYGENAGPDLGIMPAGNNWELWRGCSVVKVVENTELPGLLLPVSLGIPSWTGDIYSDVLGLPIYLYLGTTNYIRDYVGSLSLPDICRIYLTGTPNIELPISSIQCRKDQDSLSITLIVPGLTIDRILAIENRRNGNIIVYRGKKFLNGTEQLNEIFNARLSSLRYDIGTNSASATLTGNIESTVSSKVRVIKGIVYRNTINQLRRVRCDVDTFLLPGDTADLGNGETFIVNQLTFNINTDQSIMEISE